MHDIAIDQHHVLTHDGWNLTLRRVHDRNAPPDNRQPVAIIPGYGMNSFIFGYHPTGVAMEAFLAQQGLEVWSVDLRGQGKSWHPNGRGDWDLFDLSVTDLTAILQYIAANTQTGRPRIHAIGASLGGSLLFAHHALAASPHLASIIALGAPLRWEKVHPVVRLAFASPRLASYLPSRGNRKMAAFLAPYAFKLPWAVSFYIHPEISDTSDAKTLTNTVEDTCPGVNRQIAEWIRDKDLHLRGRNISRAVRHATVPLLCVVANADGVVPAETALSAYEEWGHPDKTVLVVGDHGRRFAHADLFISNFSAELVFAPMAKWIAGRG